jgi:ABC-2 type transport system permease protein
MRTFALLLRLTENETMKVLRRRRFRVVLLVLAALLSVIVFAQWKHEKGEQKEKATTDWRTSVERRAYEMERRSARARVPAAFARMMRFEAGRLRYHLKAGIDPDQKTGPLFSRLNASIASVLLIPLLVAVFASDLVSSEFSEGTVKLLLTRPVARWKVLTGKLGAMVLFTTLTILASGLLSWLIAGVAFGFSGWGAPSLTGFQLAGGSGGFDVSSVRAVPLWQDTIAAYGLSWVSALCVGCVTFLLSVVLRSSAATMGTMMATLVGGTILSRVAADWDVSKWLFVTCLPLPEYYGGVPTPVSGMTLGFCVAVLGVWSAASVALAYVLFIRRDVTE